MNTEGSPSVLLIGPYDPHCGEYTFLAPPLGVWRLAGVLGGRDEQVEGTAFPALIRFVHVRVEDLNLIPALEVDAAVAAGLVFLVGH